MTIEAMKLALVRDLNKYADLLAEGELVSPDDLNCSSIMRLAAEAIEQAQKQEPLDTPLPCDVKVGNVTMRKGVALRTLVARMQVLYDMAQGQAQKQDKFCDSNCVWTDHHPDCVRAQKQEPLCTAAMFDDAFLAKSGLSPDTKLYTSPPQRCPNCDSLERQNAELDLRLAEQDQAPFGYLTNKRQRVSFEPNATGLSNMPMTIDWKIPVYGSPQPQRQPEQEPVAWLFPDHTWTEIKAMADDHPPTVAAYASPPQRQPLTDEQIFEVHKKVDSMQYLTFTRAIEAAASILKIMEEVASEYPEEEREELKAVMLGQLGMAMFNGPVEEKNT